MKRTAFLQAVGDIDDALIMEAAPAAAAFVRSRRPLYRAVGGIAAALLLVVGVFAATRLGRMTMEDAALEDDVYDKITGEALLQDGDFVYNYNAAPAETEIVLDKSEAADFVDQDAATPETVPDTAAEGRLTALYFAFYDGTDTRMQTQEYEDGVPDAQTVVNDYLAAAGSGVRCTAFTVATTPSKTEVQGEIVTHTPGVRTATVTFTDAPDEDVLRGVLHALNQLASARYYCFETADGMRLQLGDTLPEIGYDPRDFLN